MASVVTQEFVRTIPVEAPPFSLIEQPGLLSRLIRALKAGAADLINDPRGFIQDLLSADTKDAKRRQRIYYGLACALVTHIALLVFIAMMGWRTIFVKPPAEETKDYIVTPVGIPSPIAKSGAEESSSRPGNSHGGGEAGGGQLVPLPASKGTPPPKSLLPPIVSMKPSNIADPALPMSPTIPGVQTAPPPPAPIGDPAGKPASLSGGPGKGGGIGSGDGPGIGSGKDPGAGPGGGGGTGGGRAGLPGGSGTGTPAFIYANNANSFPGYRPWSWIRKERAIITPEARENKVIGTVVLRADFNGDGTITNIEVAMPVDYMNEAAVESLRRCTFRPATINGIPVSVRKVLIRIDVHY
ncbi:MAG TPA: TonB family protein [Blastocatellia bacterium]|nr:TonB family protein [Blastocatellia bacterium]